MANIDKVSVKNTVYNIVSPAVVSDYIEVIGGACTKPDGYVEDEVILAKQNDVQLLFKATQDIAFGANIVENTNCVRTTLEEVLKNAGGGGGASSADQVSYDNSDSGLEAENVQEAVDELATNAGTASSQIQTLTNQVDAIVNVYGGKNLFQYDYPSTTINGVTITINRDKTISLNGTASADTWIILNAKVHLDTTREYILNGCPSGGSASTYNLAASDSSSWWQLDTGAGVRFTPTGADNTQIYIQFPSGTDMTGKVFKPMIRDARIADGTYEPYAMTNQEMTPYVQAISNPNLLDNPWFTVNQRGQATYNVAGYSVDRWGISNGVTATINADGSISLSSTVQYAGFAQRFIFDEFTAKLLGKTVTLSALLSDGTVKKNTFTLPSTRPSSATSYGEFEIASGVSLRLRVWDSSVIYSAIQVTMNDTSATVTLKAVKLELGTVSTLAHDTAPNYSLELLKCQRYFVRYLMPDNSGAPLGIGFYSSTTNARLSLTLPIEMRAKPTINISDISKFKIVVDNVAKVTSAVSVSGVFQNIITLNFTTDTATQYAIATLNRTTQGEYIDLSADL